MATGIPVSSMKQSYTAAPPPADPVRSRPLVPWSTGLFECYKDMPSCCLTWFCPCVTFGRISEIVDHGSSSCVASGIVYILVMYFLGCPGLLSCHNRKKIREQYGLHGGGACLDCIVHCCCEACALCQEYRELKHRGFDMSVGWKKNVEKNSPGVQMVAPVEEGMTR